MEKYNIQNNDTLIDVFDRMINTGSKTNFTEEELRMFADIERITNGSARLKVNTYESFFINTILVNISNFIF